VDIDILCKVVDNYGDAGFALRLARALSELPDPPRLRLVVDDLRALASLAPAVDAAAETQAPYGWEICRWAGGAGARGVGAPGAAPAPPGSFRERPPRVVVECFACGRPDWLEEQLFGDSAEPSLLVDLEHLSAEPYARELHLMPSLTRSSLVRKAMFLPGLEAGTGGLLLDRAFLKARAGARSEEGRAALRRELLALLPEGQGAESAGEEPLAAERLWVLAFSYERDYSRIVADLAAFQRGGDGALLVLAAAGKSQACLVTAWEAAGRPFSLVLLPFLPQEAWDRALLACDFSIVRGEDSWARAMLAGRPFLWQAYPQEGRHQLVKVEAFLEILRPHLAPEDFRALAPAFRALNDRDADSPGTAGDECLAPVLERLEELRPAFEAFAASLDGLGNLAAGLLAFLLEAAGEAIMASDSG
jgi:uncharacterized repeat protein (TIGR03837 family)